MELQDALTHQNARDFKSYLKCALKSGTPCHIDLSGVKRASLSCVQLLVSIQKYSQPDDVTISLSKEMRDIVHDLGLEDFFNKKHQEKKECH